MQYKIKIKVEKILFYLKKEIHYIPKTIREDIKYGFIYLGLAIIIKLLLDIFL